ncbi:unnamed protein product [Arabidopsis halleri]
MPRMEEVCWCLLLCSVIGLFLLSVLSDCGWLSSRIRSSSGSPVCGRLSVWLFLLEAHGSWFSSDLNWFPGIVCGL